MRGASSRRHRGRELALRVLFELEGTRRDPEEAFAYRVRDAAAPADVAAFAHRLVTGTLRHAGTVDAAIAGASTNWSLEDLGKVERAILRLAAYELLQERSVPVGVAIDEALELTRTYAGEEAAPFVNGVLARIAAERSGSQSAAAPTAG